MGIERACKFIESTDTALIGLFENLAFFHGLEPLDPLNPDTSNPDDPYWGQRKAQDVVAGSILQITTMAIRLKGMKGKPSKTTDQIDAALLKQEKRKRNSLKLDPKYFWGRLESDIPIGTIIHSARNLYAHFDQTPDKKVRAVFDHLAATNITGPQAFDLTIKNRLIGNLISSNVMWRLGWIGHDLDHVEGHKIYVEDIMKLLQQE